MRPDFERDREEAIMRQWRASVPLPEMLDYFGMEEVDLCAIIRRNLNTVPTLGWRYPKDIKRAAVDLRGLDLSIEKARELLDKTTTGPLRKRLEEHLRAA